MPLKRKTDKVHDYRQQKKIDLKDVAEHIDSESDSELSDSSVTLSQSEFSSRNFDVDDIKLFLQSTKNKSGGFSQWVLPRCRTVSGKSKEFYDWKLFFKQGVSFKENSAETQVIKQKK